MQQYTDASETSDPSSVARIKAGARAHQKWAKMVARAHPHLLNWLKGHSGPGQNGQQGPIGPFLFSDDLKLHYLFPKK